MDKPTTANSPAPGSFMDWWKTLIGRFSASLNLPDVAQQEAALTAKEDAKNRLRLVLMHDRTQLSPSLLESMRDELVEVISKYVEIDQKALDLCLEQEANNIALVANISVIRPRQVEG